MRLPFVSREHHDAVLAERERVIVALRATIALLERRLEQPIPVTVALPKDFAVIQPAVVQSPRRKKKADAEVAASLKAIDLAEVDEFNLELVARLAVAKYGRKAHNQFELKQFIRGVQTEIRAAKAAKKRRLAKEKAEPEPVVEQLQEGIDLDEQVDEANVPAHIKRLIEVAEGGE